MMSKEESQVRIERVDDIPLLYGLLEQMGIQEIIDRAINPHGNWAGLSPGWVITLWLVHILSEQNHLMEPVQPSKALSRSSGYKASLPTNISRRSANAR